MSVVVTFGGGGDEPYALSLGEGGGRLALHRVGAEQGVELDAAVWHGPADATDLRVLTGLEGPLLDVGCGPGRMLRAATERGIPTLGIDVSTAAVALAAQSGAPVLHRSVFDRLPLEGQWHAVLLLDGNIGIGGDPAALLARCAHLLDADGSIIVEVDADPDLDERDHYRAIRDDGTASAAFPWARVGSTVLARVAASVRLRVADAWTDEDRHFVVLRFQS